MVFDRQDHLHTLTLHPDVLVTLDSYRLKRFLDDGSLAHLALGSAADDIVACRDAMFEAKEAGDENWFETAGGDRYYLRADVNTLRMSENYYFDSPLTIFDEDLQLTFRSRTDRSELGIPVNRNSLAVIGGLLSRLNYSKSLAALGEELDSAEWNFLKFLNDQKLVDLVPVKSKTTNAEYSVTLAGHSCLVIKTPTSRVLVDPLLVVRHRPEVRLEEYLGQAYDAVVISHPHWDHLNIDSLLLVPRETPIIIPRLRSRKSIVNIDMEHICAELGFTAIKPVIPWEAVTIGDIEFTSLPFYGEGSGLEGQQDWQTYHFRFGGKNLVGVVDACADSFGSMDDVLREVRVKFGATDLFFSPCANFQFQVSHFYRKPFELSRALEQFTGSAEDTLRWAEILDAKQVLPYAEFAYDESDLNGGIKNPAQFGSHEDLYRIASDAMLTRITLLEPGTNISWSNDPT